MLGPALMRATAGGGAPGVTYATLEVGTIGQTLDGDLLGFQTIAGGRQNAYATIGKDSGQHYFEVLWASGTPLPMVGMVSAKQVDAAGTCFAINNRAPAQYGFGWYMTIGRLYKNGLSSNLFWDSLGSAGMVLPVYMDCDARLLYGYKTGVGWKPTDLALGGSGEIFAAVGALSSTDGALRVNFGQAPFTYPFGDPPPGVNRGLYL